VIALIYCCRTRKQAYELESARQARYRQETAGGAEVVDQRNYIFDIDTEQLFGSRDQVEGKPRYSVDCWAQGNWTRFLNHSCESVLRPYTAFVDAPDPNLRRLVFAAKKDVPAGTELTVDYDDPQYFEGVAEEDKKGETKPCYCGTASCRGQIKA